MMEFDWQTFLFYFVLEPLIFLFFFGIAIGWLNEHRKNSVIAVDFDTLVDVAPIIERGKIWAINNNKPFDEYFDAHIVEQTPNPSGLVRALRYQQLGYTLCFVSARPERLRIDAARFLNAWKLRGELYMCSNKVPIEELIEHAPAYKQLAYDEIASNIERKLVGIIDSHSGLKGICKEKRSKKK